MEPIPEFITDINALQTRLHKLLESEKRIKIMASDQAMTEIDRLKQMLHKETAHFEVTPKALDKQSKTLRGLEGGNAAQQAN
jgi:diphthamide synthase subunit DPH2